MAGRGPQTFRKRQKEEQRREKQQEKVLRRQQRSQLAQVPSETPENPGDVEQALEEKPDSNPSLV